MSVRDRQDAVLADPFQYKADDQKVDISGGNISEFDRESFKKDLNNVFNP